MSGVRALIDSASLLWRWRMTTSDWPAAGSFGGPDEGAPPPIGPVLDAVDPALLLRPQTPFIALHAAIALAAAGDTARLRELGQHCRRSRDSTLRGSVATLCQALEASTESRWEDAASLIEDVLPVLARVGGSAAQREVIEETLLISLVNAGRADQASALLDERLHRRPSPLDLRRRDSLAPAPAAPAPTSPHAAAVSR